MRFRRVVAFVTASTAALCLLTACDKPSPIATVFSGSQSASREALCWSPEPDQPLDSADCLIGESSATLTEAETGELADYLTGVDVDSGQTIGISVDSEVAESGWSVAVNGRRRNADLITETYFRFTLSERQLRGRALELQVIAPTTDLIQRRGLWVFELRPSTTQLESEVSSE